MESQLQLKSKKRGGAKDNPVHLGMMILSTVLLTIAGLLLVYHLNFLGIIVMILGIAVRVIDTRL